MPFCFLQGAGASEQPGWETLREPPPAQQRAPEPGPCAGQNPPLQPTPPGLQMVKQGNKTPRCDLVVYSHCTLEQPYSRPSECLELPKRLTFFGIEEHNTCLNVLSRLKGCFN